MSIVGDWIIIVDTPMGKQECALQLGSTEGKIETDSGSADLQDVKCEGNEASFSAKIPGAPAKATITLEADGDNLAGLGKMGPVMKFKITGARNAG